MMLLNLRRRRKTPLRAKKIHFLRLKSAIKVITVKYRTATLNKIRES